MASLVNTGTTHVNAALTTGGTINNKTAGTLNQKADITATGTVTNDGQWNVTGARQLTSGGLDGAGSIAVAQSTDALTISQSANSTYAGTITGAGKLIKTGVGSLTMTGTSDVTGQLDVNKGALNIAGSSKYADVMVRSLASLNVADGGALKTDRMSIQSQAAAQIKSGAQLQAQSVKVDGSLLLNNGALFNANLLNGAGTVQATDYINPLGSTVAGTLRFTGNFYNKGVVSPGNSPGTLTVDGNYIEAGTYNAEIAGSIPGLQHDQVRVGGTITIQPGAILNLVALNGYQFQRGVTYQLYSGLQGQSKPVSGTFQNVLSSSSTNGTATANYSGLMFDVATGQVIVTGITGPSGYAELAQNASQLNAVNALFSEKSSAWLGQNQLNSKGTSDQQLMARLLKAAIIDPRGVEKVAPQVVSTMGDYLAASSDAISRIPLLRAATGLGTEAESQRNFFTTGITERQHSTSTSKLNRTDGVVGISWKTAPNWSLGGLVAVQNGGYSETLGTGTARGNALRLFAQGQFSDGWGLMAQLGTSKHDMAMNRSGLFGGLSGNTDASITTAGLGVLHRTKAGNAELVPFANFDIAQIRLDGFEEQGNDSRLTYKSLSNTRSALSLGGQANWRLNDKARPTTLGLWAMATSVVNQSSTNQFVNLSVQPNVGYTLVYDNAYRTQFLVGLNGVIPVGTSGKITLGLDANTRAGGHLNTRIQYSASF